MDLLRRWLRKLKSTTIIAVQLRNETTAIWENNGDKTTKYEHWGKTTIEVWNKREKSLPD